MAGAATLALCGSAARPEPRTDAPAEIAAEGIGKRFGNKTILAGVSFSIRRGETVALIGANGAGKSTLLRCLLRLVEPDQGEALMLGVRTGALGPRALRRLRARVGFVFQKHNLVPRLSVLSNVLHGALGRAGVAALHAATAPAALRREALGCLDRVGLAALASRRADTLSGGQSQRVAIARVLMQRPSALLADEPVASLDPAAGEEVMALFSTLARENGLTLLFATHSMAHAAGYADRVIGLRAGRIALEERATPGLAPALEGFFA